MKCPGIDDLPSPPKFRTGWPWTEGTPILNGVSNNEDDWPIVSIVTPSYNQGQFIEETIRSVLLQGYPNLEYIIIDGNSCDNSVEVIKKYERWLTYWISEPDKGQSNAINKGFNTASGMIYGWLNSDDYYNKYAIQTLVELKKSKPEYVAWVGSCYDIDKEGNLLRKRYPRVGNSKQFGNWGEDGDAWIGQPACLFDAETFKEIGGVDEKLNYALDVDLWIRLAENGEFCFTDKIIALDRKYPGIKSYSDRPMQQAEIIFVNIKSELPEIARKRMEDILARYLDSLPYRDLLKIAIKRTRTWLLRLLAFILKNKLMWLSKIIRLTSKTTR